MAMPTASVSIAGQGIPAYSGIHAYEIWSPLAIPSLQLWLDGRRRVYNSISPDVPATNGQTVRRWGNSANPGTYDADQSVLADRPTYDAVNSSIVFDGVSDYLQSDFPLVGNDWCVAMIFEAPTPIVLGRIASAWSVGNQDWSTAASIAFIFLVSDFCWQHNNVLGPQMPYTPGRQVFIVNSTPSGVDTILNGSVSSSAAFSGSINATALTVGAGYNGAAIDYFQNAPTIELLTFNQGLDSTQLSQLQAWADTL